MKTTIPQYILDAAKRRGHDTNTSDLALIAKVLPRENDLAVWTLEVYGEGQVLALVRDTHQAQAKAHLAKLPAWRRGKVAGIYTHDGVACTGLGFRIQRPRPKATPAPRPKAEGQTPTYFEVHLGGPDGVYSVPRYDDPRKA